MMSLPYSAPDGQVLRTPHLIGSSLGPTRVIGTGAIKSENYVAGSAGWSIDGDGNVEFNDGDFRGDITGASGTFSGTVSGGQIDIGGSDTSSFHVDADGNMWLGAGTYLGAPFKVSKAGEIDIGSGAFTVDISGNVVANSIDVATVLDRVYFDTGLTNNGYISHDTNSLYIQGAGDIWFPNNATTEWPPSINMYNNGTSRSALTLYAATSIRLGDGPHPDIGYALSGVPISSFYVELHKTNGLTASLSNLTVSSTGWGFAGRTPSSTYEFDIGYDTMRLASGTSGYAYLQFGASSTAAQNSHLVNNGSNGVLLYSGNVGSGTLRYGFYTNLPYAFVWGEWAGGSAYSAFTTSGAGSTGYLMLTDNGTTYISTVNTGYSVYIRPSANSTTYQLVVSTTGVAATLAATASTTAVVDAGFGVLGYTTSRSESKENVKPVKSKDALGRILALRPVEFTYKKDYIGEGTNDMVPLHQQRGFIAEEVEAVDRVAAVYGWLEPGDRKRLAKPRETPLRLEDAECIHWNPNVVVADLVAVIHDLHERITTLEAK